MTNPTPDPSNTPIDELTEPIPADDPVYDLVRRTSVDPSQTAIDELTEPIPADDPVYDLVRDTDTQPESP